MPSKPKPSRTVPRLVLTLEVVGSRPDVPPVRIYQRSAEAEHWDQHKVLIPWLLELASVSAGREEARLRELLGIRAFVHVELPEAADAL